MTLIDIQQLSALFGQARSISILTTIVEYGILCPLLRCSNTQSDTMDRNIPWNDFKHLLVIRRNAFGDLLCSLPLINYIKQQNPTIKITLVVQSTNAPITPYIPNIDHVIIADAANKYVSALKLKFLTLRKKYDCAIGITAPSQNLMNLMLTMVRSRYRIAYCAPFNRFSKSINIKRDCPDLSPPTQHIATTYLQLANPNIKSINQKLYPELHIPNNIVEKYAPYLKQSFIETALPNTPIFLISLTNNREHSTLAQDKMVKVLNSINNIERYNVILSCMNKDVSKAQELEQQLNFSCKVAATKTLDEFLVLLSFAKYVFTGDGGTMHMAAALNKPQLVLFGDTKVKEWYPLSDKATNIQGDKHVNSIPNDVIISAINNMLKE